MLDVHYVHVKWEGPLTRIEAQTRRNSQIDFGVYQVYGAHPLYGSGVLLYIGKCESLTFGLRFSQHYDWLHGNSDRHNVQIYLGRLHTSGPTPLNTDWERQIRQVESLLIYAHGPAANSSGLNKEMGEDFHQLHVLNWGNFRSLLPEVSGARYSNRFWNNEQYNPYTTSA